MTEQTFNKSVTLRFDEHGHTLLWCDYNAAFIAAMKTAFNDKSIDCIGAEWDGVLKCWHIYTGWVGCEDWINQLVALLNKFYPS
jgi:hypothetical protein